MRKIYYFMSAAVIALGLASCNKGEATLNPEQPTDQQITIVASTEGCVDTKTTLSGDDATGYQVLWSEGDKIHLNDGWNSEFTLKDGAGTARGTFVGTATDGDGDYKAYYGVTGMYMPDVTNYMGENVISSVPMVASVSIRDGVASVAEFKNMCGLLRLTLKGSGDVKQIKIYATENMYGDFRVEDDCSMTIKRGTPTNFISHYCGDGVALSGEGTDFYIPLPPIDYSGVKIEIIDCSGNICTKTLKSDKKINIGRSLITPVSLTVTGLEKKPDVPDGALYGVFTVNADGKKVYFSRGNMYWDGDSFELEEHQYDYPKGWESKHVGHLYWSRYAYRAYHDVYSTAWYDWASDDVLFTNMPKYPERPNKDFTVNGVTGKFRTLSDDEWNYLFQHHSHKWITIHNTKGYVIAPDGVELDKPSYSEEDLMSQNLVFIPVTGYRHVLLGRQNFYDTNIGFYFSSSKGTNASHAHALIIDGDNSDESAKIVTGDSFLIESRACCIRLVTDVDYEDPLESTEIEKPEEGENYDWE